MDDVKYAGLLELMPDNLLEDEKIRNATEALDKELKKFSDESELVLIIPRIDELDGDMLDMLAWQWHVDFYSTDYDVETKRKLLRQSLDWHRHKGTPWAVKAIVDAVFSDAKVIENWEYSGNPYCFRVQVDENTSLGEDTVTALLKSIMAAKNTRSQMDGIVFHRDLDANMYLGGVTDQFRSVSIPVPGFSPPILNQSRSMGGIMNINKAVAIGIKTLEEAQELSRTKYISGIMNINKSVAITKEE